MIKQHFKQAWTMMRQNKLFTSIYVAGTGLSIAFTMVLFIIYYVKFAPVYPEYNRDRTLVISCMAVAQKGEKTWNNYNAGVNTRAKDLVKGLPHLDKVGLALLKDSRGGNTVLLPESQELLSVNAGKVDAGFWEVFTFRFLSGKPFDEAAVESGLPVAVITEKIATRIFASTDVAGKYFKYNGNDIQVAGVVADVTGVTPASAADLYFPLHYEGQFRPSPRDRGLMGSLQLYMTATSADDVETLRSEVVDVLNRYNQENQEWEHFYMEQPDVWWKSQFRVLRGSAPDIAGSVRSILYMLLALLFIPAMNLCGMISSRMDERMSELGVRKAYGANNASLISQVLTENLLLTLVGGLVGLVLAYFIALIGGEEIYHLTDTGFVLPGGLEPSFTMEMLFNPTLFLTVFGLCILLNLISALVPTILALRHTIIHSIQTKR